MIQIIYVYDWNLRKKGVKTVKMFSLLKHQQSLSKILKLNVKDNIAISVTYLKPNVEFSSGLSFEKNRTELSSMFLYKNFRFICAEENLLEKNNLKIKFIKLFTSDGHENQDWSLRCLMFF